MISKKTLFSLASTLGGMPVLSTLPNSPAARAGIRYGDVVLSVNGEPTPGVAEYVRATTLRRDGMSVVLFRNGAEQSIDLSYERDATPPDLESVVKAIMERRALSDFPEPPDGSEDT